MHLVAAVTYLAAAIATSDMMPEGSVTFLAPFLIAGALRHVGMKLPATDGEALAIVGVMIVSFLAAPFAGPGGQAAVIVLSTLLLRGVLQTGPAVE